MLIGEKTGTFTVIDELCRLKSNLRRFLLKCDCGAEVIKTKWDLRRWNVCRACSYKKYEFEQRGEFECIECKEIFSLDKLKKSNPNYYCCPFCRLKRERNRVGRKKEVDKLFREKERIRISVLSSLKAESFRKNGIAAKYLGCSKDEFNNHIASLFRSGMSWDNRDEFEIDHAIPLSEVKEIGDIKKLWHYSNLQPLWGWENNLKSNRLDWREDEWAKELVELRIKLGLE